MSRQKRGITHRGRRLRLLGSGSVMAAAVAFAGLLSANVLAQPLVQAVSQPQPMISGPMHRPATSAVANPALASLQRGLQARQVAGLARSPASIAARDYVEAKGMTLDAPRVPIRSDIPRLPVSRETPVILPPSGPAAAPPVPAPTPPPAGNAGPSLDSIRNAVNAAGFDAARDGVNVRATAQYDSGTVDFRPNAGGDVVELLASNAIINWDTFVAGTGGNTVSFLGTGGQLEFTSALSDYTVLNRVFTGAIDSAIRIDGTVTSTVNGGTATGGNVWFYSPGGVIIGSTGAFNVGGLVLTSSQMDNIGANGTLMSFSGAADPSSAIVIERGANITTSNYLALVAPRVEQHGMVNSNGSVAYVAAEQAQLTINNGLFDISVAVGSDDANGIVHTGTTTGPAASGDLRAISMVAVPKNSAMTMLVGGDIGYQAAGAVSVDDDGKIILTAGDNGSVEITDAKLTGNAAVTAGDSVRLGASQGGSTSASGNLAIIAGANGASGGVIEIASAGSIDIGGNLSLDVSAAGDRNTTLGRGQVDISANGAGASINIGGDLTVDASTNGIITEASGAVVHLSANNTGPTDGIRVGGTIAVDTTAASGSDFIATEAGGVVLDAEGGAIAFGSLSFDGRASATGASLGQTGDGDDYRGGAFSLRVGEGGSITGGSVTIDNSAAGVDGKGGYGSGGSVDLALAGGELTLGRVTIDSTGIGGDAPDNLGLAEFGADPIGGFGIQRTAAATNFPSAGDGGDGTGGDTTMNFDGGTATIEFLAVTTEGVGSDGIDGDSLAGTDGGNGGDGIGGTATFNGTSGTLNVSIGIDISASAVGGNGGTGAGSDGGNGGQAIGGTATFNMNGSAALTTNSILVRASAVGGDGGASTIGPLSDPAHNAGNGGNATAGAAIFDDTAGTLSASSVGVYADAYGGNGGFAQSGGGSASLGGTGGTATAGTATINLNQDDVSDRDYYASAGAFGGNGGGGDIAGNGGNAAGGFVTININDAQIAAGTIVLDAFAAGGIGGSSNLAGSPGGNGGNALGGTASLIADGVNADYSTSVETYMTVEAVGGDGGDGGSFGTLGGDGGLGGDATGGNVVVTSRNNASLNLFLNSGAAASARGGDGGSGGGGTVLNGTGGSAGAAQGGAIAITAETGGALDIDGPSGFASTDASANGGRGGGFPEFGQRIPGANGGSNGGSVSITADGPGSALSVSGTLDVSTSANGTSDFRSDSTSQGAIGGAIDVSVTNGANLSVSGNLNLFSIATAAGGANDAANGQGGSVSFAVGDASGASFGTLQINVDGNGVAGISSVGTAGSNGGGGLGGSVDISVGSGATLVATSLVVTANGTGAAGGEGDSGFTGGAGGFGIGGDVTFSTGSDVQVFDTFVLDAEGTGGDGGNAGVGLVSGASGGDAGFGEGGIVRFEASGTGSLLPSFGGVQLRATGTGGLGGSGATGDSTTQSGTGGHGGAGIGGSTTFATSGVNATFTLTDFLVSMDTLGLGGSGGAGGNNFLSGTGGTGGVGGDASGGVKTIEAGSGSTITLQPTSTGPFFFSANAFAGNGGFGGSLDLTNGGVQGAGGDGGTATGGSPVLRSLGGTITSGDVDIYATGFGGAGGLGGDDGNATLGPSGNGGDAVGGTPILETFDGSPGIITLGTVIIDASAVAGGGTLTGTTAGGQIVIADGSADPAGLISMTSLTATVTGTAGTPSLIISSNSGPITVTNNVNADVSGDIVFDFDGDGQFDVGGTVTLNSGGAITGTHTSNGAGFNSIHAGTDLVANAGTDIDFAPGFIAAAGRDINLLGQNVTFHQANGLRDVIINAATGNLVGTGNLDAGRDANLDAAFLIDVQNVTGTRDITIDAGTDITAGDVTLTGPDFIGAQRVLINGGGDVSLGHVDAIDALQVAGQNVGALSLDGESVDVIAGGLIDVGTATSETTIDFLSTDIILDNGDAVQNITLDAMGGAISLGTVNSESQLIATASGDIDFTNLTGRVVTLDAGGSITGGSAAADRTIISGIPRNVNLTAGGLIDIDSASAVDSVVASGSAFAATSLDAGNIISVIVPGAIDIGTSDSGNETVLTGGSVLLGDGVAVGGVSAITATAGPVNIGTFDTNNFVNIIADTTVDFVTLSGRRLTISANGDVTGTRAATDVALISGLPRNVEITTSGAVNVDQIDTVNNIVINAASVDTNLLDAGGDIDVTVSGLADIVQVTSTGSTTITADTVLIGNGVSTGLALLTSTGGNVTIGDWDTQGFFDIDAAQDAIFGTVTGRVVDIVAVGDITGTSAATDVALISGRPRNVNLDGGGLVTIGNTASIGNTIVNGGAVNAGTLGADGSVTVTATGAAEVDNLQSGGAASVTGADVTLIDGNVGLGLTANALTGDLAINGTMTVGRNINLDAFRNVNFGTLETTGGSLDANAGGDIIFGSATANVDIDLIAAGVVGGNVVDGRIVTVSAASLDIGSLTATFSTNVVSNTGDLLIGTLNSAGNASLDSAADLIVTDSISGTITAVSVNDINISNVTTIGTAADVRLDAGGSLRFELIDSDRLVNLDAVGSINGGTIIGDAQVDLLAGSIAVGDVTSDGGFVLLESNVGGVSASNLTATIFGVSVISAGDTQIGDTSGGGSLTVRTAGDTVMGDADFGANINIITGGLLDAGHLVSAAVSPGLGITAGGDANIASASASGLLDINVGGALTGGAFTGSGVTTIDAASVDIVSVESTSGTLRVDAPGAIIIDRIGSAFAANITGGSVTVNDGAVGNLLALDATAGDISGTGTITVGGAIVLDATGNIGFGTLNAANGNFRATAGGDINFVGATSNANVDFTAGGAIGGGDLDAGITLTLDAASIAIGDAVGNAINLTSLSDILFDSLTTPNAITINAANGTIGANTGPGDIVSGSTVTMLSQSIDVGDVTSGTSVNAQATAGDASFGIVDAVGAITINAAGSPSVGGLISGGNATLNGTSVTLASGDVGGDLVIDAMGGDILLSVAGSDQILVAGSTSLNASGDITIIHTDNSSNRITLDSGGNILAAAQGNFDAQQQTILSGNEVFILAGSDVSANDLRAVPGIVITAGGSVIINDAVAVGPQGISNFNGIIIDAGLNPFGGSAYDNLGDVLVTGTIDSYSNINIRSGGSTYFDAGSTTVANDRLFVQTGDDIVVGSGATLISARAPSSALDVLNPFNGVAALELDAGGNTNLLGTPVTPIASLAVYGTLDANNSAILATANAIDGLGGNFIGSSISLDVRDAPNPGFAQSDDGGFLTPNCLAGNICVGNIQADNILAIGQSSNNDVIQLIVEQGTVDANQILITTRNDIVMGTDGIATVLNAASLFSATSTSGDVDLRDANISSTSVSIDAAGSVFGTGVVTADLDAGITAGQDIILSSIDAGRELTSAALVGGAAEGTFSTPGNLVVGTITVGAGNVDYNAGGDLRIGTLIVPGTDVSLTAGGTAQLDLSQTANDLGISATDALLGTILTVGSVNVGATDSVDFTNIDAGSNIDITAGGAVTGGDLNATNNLAVSGGLIAIGSGAAANINLVSASDILFNSLLSPNAISLDASLGTIGNNGGAGDIDSDGDISLIALAIDVNDLTSGGSVSADATAGDATFGTVDAVNGITIAATGTPTLANAISGGNTSVTGASVMFDNGTVGGDLALTATVGNIASNGAVTVGGGIALDAAGDVTFDSLVAQNGDFTISAGGNVLAEHAEASGDFISNSIGTFTTGLNSIITGGDIIINSANQVNLGNSTAGGLIDVTGSQIDFANLIAGQTIDLLTIATANTSGGNGNITGTTVDAGGNIDATSAASITVGSFTSGGDITAIADGAFAVDTVTAAQAGTGLVDISAHDGIAIQTLTGNSAQLVSVAGPVEAYVNIDVTGLVTAQGTSVLLRAAGDLLAHADASGGDVYIESGANLTVSGASATGSIDTYSTGNTAITSIVDAADSLTIGAGGALDIRATASGANVDVAVADINIGSTGALGRSDRTETIDISTNGDIYLGGAGGLATGFELDQDEFTRVFSGGDITIRANAPASGGGGILTVDDLDVLAATPSTSPTAIDGNIASSGTLTLRARDTIDVIGGLTVVNAGTDTSLVISAGNQINVDVDSGNLRMEEDTNILAGNIELSATSIIAISTSAAADIAGASADNIDIRLGQNDGTVRDEGYFQSTNLTFNVDENLLIQNSGDGTGFDDRRGFTADSVTINEIDPVGPIVIIINGLVSGETGVDALALVNITTAFDQGSTINGCLIADPSGCVSIFGPEGPAFENPLQDLVEEEIEEDSPVGVKLNSMIIEFRDDPQSEADPLINEPVTGAGNEDLWVDDQEQLEPAE